MSVLVEPASSITTRGTLCKSAGLGKTRERDALAREHDRLAAQVEQMLAEAAAPDAAQDRLFGPDRGDELPPALRRKAGRLAGCRKPSPDRSGSGRTRRRARQQKDRAATT